MRLLPHTSILLTASAASVPLQPRGDRCEGDPDPPVIGPSTDGAAGIGAEFESPAFYFKSDCSDDDTFASKGKVIGERTGPNWALTADTGGQGGRLNAEYVLSGKDIKVGSGDAAKAGKAIADDLIGWHPWTGDRPQTVNVADSKCNPWTIDGPSKRQKPEPLPWSPQITAPMPLEALYSLMDELIKDPDDLNPLNGINFLGNNLVLVTKDFFQSKPNDIDGSKVTDDVLGFCSLVLSYAKAAKTLARNQSPKLFLTYMPRTEFNTIFKQVESKLPGDKLFDLFNTLACYKNNKGNLEFDTTYCGGSLEKPEPNDKFGALEYKTVDKEVSVKIKDWIQGIGKKDPSPDLLTKFDESIDKSIGGFKDATEKIYNGERSVPLFEFRDLPDVQTSGIEKLMSDADIAIQDLHKKFAGAPKKNKRDDCPTPTPPTPAPNDVKPVDPPSQPICVPNPTDSVKDAHEDKERTVAEYFCREYAKDTDARAPIDIKQTVMGTERYMDWGGTVLLAIDYLDSMGNQDDVYDITIKSIDKCTPANGNNLASPVAGHTCEDILYHAWKNCTGNQGRGGAITVGCLVYSIKTRF